MHDERAADPRELMMLAREVDVERREQALAAMSERLLDAAAELDRREAALREPREETWWEKTLGQPLSSPLQSV